MVCCKMCEEGSVLRSMFGRLFAEKGFENEGFLRCQVHQKSVLIQSKRNNESIEVNSVKILSCQRTADFHLESIGWGIQCTS